MRGVMAHRVGRLGTSRLEDPLPDVAQFETGIVRVGTLCGVPSTRRMPIKT